MSSHIANIAIACVSVALMAAPNAATAQRTTITKALSGQMLPLQPLPPGMQPTVSTVMNRIRLASCKPSQPTGGPGPSWFSSIADWPSGLEFMWPAVPGAVAYLVERAVDDGTYVWAVVGSTCGSPDALREYVIASGDRLIVFRDIAGGFRAGETYVYKVTAVGAKGELGWNSFRWTQLAYLPSVTNTTVTGSTVELTVSQNCWRFGSEVLITASYGLNQSAPFSTNGVCVAPNYTTVTSRVVIYGVPDGTHAFSVATLWIQTLDPNMPRVVGTSSAASSTTITIKP